MFSKRALRCMDPIESQYYNPVMTGSKGRRITMDDICALCYEREDLHSVTELITRCDLGGEVPLVS